ncbi:MAG TPA: polysaccharide deacetylase family protein [Gammaproteobacteria bacterium]
MNYRTKKKLIHNFGKYGLYGLSRLLTRKYPRVLMYHRFSANGVGDGLPVKAFEAQMKLVANNFNPITLDHLCECRKKSANLPDNPVIITVDDGYQDFYDLAYPILKRYSIPATIYITVNFIEQKIWLWPDKVTYVLKQINEPVLHTAFIDKIDTCDTVNKDSREVAWNYIIGKCISMAPDARDSYIHELASAAGVSMPEFPPEDYAGMTWLQVRELSDNGIDIGAHTCNHPILSKIPDDQLIDEIDGCKRRIEANIGRNVNNFCYPNGRRDDYNSSIKEMIIASGYETAATSFYDKDGCNDLFELRRHGVGNDMYHFQRVINGIEYLGTWL